MLATPDRRASLPIRLALLLLASLATPVVTSAQTLSPGVLSTVNPLATRPARSACVESIPDSALVPTVLYLHPSEPVDLDTAAIAQIDGIELVTQLVADKLRKVLRAVPDTIPKGEPLITWRNYNDPVLVTGYPDGQFLPLPMVDSTGAAITSHPLLATLIDSLRADGERFLWTPSNAGDSARFALELVAAQFGADGKLTHPAVRIGLPVATIMAPRMQAVKVTKARVLRRPEFERRPPYTGTITMEFVIDSAGRAVPSSIRNVSPPWLTADMVVIYDAYVGAVRRHIEATIYEPARVSRCGVSQLIRQTFDFARL